MIRSANFVRSESKISTPRRKLAKYHQSSTYYKQAPCTLVHSTHLARESGLGTAMLCRYEPQRGVLHFSATSKLIRISRSAKKNLSWTETILCQGTATHSPASYVPTESRICKKVYCTPHLMLYGPIHDPWIHLFGLAPYAWMAPRR